jgi:hypothetical protein
MNIRNQKGQNPRREKEILTTTKDWLPLRVDAADFNNYLLALKHE